MRLRARDADRLERVAFVERLADEDAHGRRPVAGLVGEFRRRIRNKLIRTGCGGARGNPRACLRGDSRRGRCHTVHGRNRDRRPRRNVADHPIEQRGGIGRHAERSRERCRILGRHAVDHGQARIGGGAVARIDAAVDGGREHHAPAFLKPDEILAPGRIVGGEIGARDGDQAAAFGEAREGRADMAQRGVGDAALDMRGCREGRVHQHDAGANAPRSR